MKYSSILAQKSNLISAPKAIKLFVCCLYSTSKSTDVAVDVRMGSWKSPRSLMHWWHVIIPSVLMRRGATLQQQTNKRRKQTGIWVIIVCEGIIVPDSV